MLAALVDEMDMIERKATANAMDLVSIQWHVHGMNVISSV